MARQARIVFPKFPHHITQRGNRRGNVFFSPPDYNFYKHLLREYSLNFGVELLAYCLMPNHIHLVAVPRRENSFHLTFKAVHTQYAQRINHLKEWTGHLWEGRFFSSPMDEAYTWAAIRYIERNPLRADLVRTAEEYPWSSAPGHCGLLWDKLLTLNPEWQNALTEIDDWSDWLCEREDEEKIRILRRHGEKNFPCGDEEFLLELERKAGRTLRPRPRGRPKRGRENGDGHLF